MYENTIIIIPFRKNSTRYYNKFFARILDKHLIDWVIEQAKKTHIPNLYVACNNEEYFQYLKNLDINVVLTSDTHESGTDRVYEALEKIDPEGKYENIINLQGDVPFIPHGYINLVAELLTNKDEDLVTLAAKIDNITEINNPNVVKIALNETLHAIYFSRSAIPFNAPVYFHHIGLYGFKRTALKQFVSLPMGSLEKIEKLEQLRALENGLKIKVGIVDAAPVSIDAPEDVEKATLYATQYLIDNPNLLL